MINREARQLIVPFCRRSTDLDPPSNSALNKQQNVAANVAGTSLVHTGAHSGTCNERIINSLCVRLACSIRHKRTSESGQSKVNPVRKLNCPVKRSSGMPTLPRHKPTPKGNSESELQQLNGSMQQGSSSKGDRKKYSAVCANTNIRYRIYSAPSFVHNLSQTNTTHALPYYFFNNHLILS